MILRTKYGLDFNPDKIWAVEWGITTEDRHGNEYIYWSICKKYISQRRMLQALEMYKIQKPTHSKISLNGGKTWKIRHHYFRPIHVEYTYELSNICDKSLREYKLKQLLEKNNI